MERTWSMMRQILCYQPNKLEPIMLEALVYLKIKRDLWDKEVVSKAYSKVIQKDRTDRLAKKLEQMQLETKDLDGMDDDDSVEDMDEVNDEMVN
ncbi:hypothetical protein ACHAXN_000923 [Cyclotella atomus]